MKDLLLPASGESHTTRLNIDVALAFQAEGWLTETLERVSNIKEPLNDVQQYKRCLTEILSGSNAIWQLCSIIFPKAPDPDPLVKALDHFQIIHIEAYVVNVDMVSQHEVAFKLTQETIEALVEYHKSITTNVSVNNNDWTKREQQVKNFQQRFAQDVNRYIFRTDIKALEGLEDQGVGELLEGRSEDAKNAIQTMLFECMNTQASRLPWPHDVHTVRSDSYNQSAGDLVDNRTECNRNPLYWKPDGLSKSRSVDATSMRCMAKIGLHPYLKTGSLGPTKEDSNNPGDYTINTLLKNDQSQPQKCSFCNQNFSAVDEYRYHL